MESILQGFLEGSLLQFAEDDEKLRHFQKAADEIAKILQKKKSEIVPYVLVSLDPEASADEPVFAEVEKQLTKQWATYRNRYPDPPRQLLRAIILEALRKMADNEVSIATMIWLTGNSFLPYVNLGRETEIITNLIRSLGDRAEQHAARLWSDSPQPTLPAPPELILKLTPDSITAPTIDIDALTERMAAAVGPETNEDYELNDPKNPNWPSADDVWAYEFASIASNGIAEAVDGSLKEVSDFTIQQLKVAFAELNRQLTIYVAQVNAHASQQTGIREGAAEYRTALLWWKETLYSPTLQKSFRSLNPAEAALVMAIDLHNQVPEYCPQSVEYLLRETIHTLLARNHESVKIRLSDFVSMVRVTPDLPKVQQRLPGTNKTRVGRQCLLQSIEIALANDNTDEQEAWKRAGISGDIEVEVGELAVWLFRDLQARRLAGKGDR